MLKHAHCALFHTFLHLFALLNTQPATELSFNSKKQRESTIHRKNNSVLTGKSTRVIVVSIAEHLNPFASPTLLRLLLKSPIISLQVCPTCNGPFMYGNGKVTIIFFLFGWDQPQKHAHFPTLPAISAPFAWFGS